jgi:hypothetical protein
MSASTTTAPVEAGIYCNRPTWATSDPEVEDGWLSWFTVVGEDEGHTYTVGVARRDGLVGDTYSRIDPAHIYVTVDDLDRTPADARALAALLVQAADIAEGAE